MANIRKISKELQQIAIDELNEDVSRIPDDIEAVKEWLQQKKYINARTDDQFILTFLRCCKFSLERTKQKIEAYYTIRTLMPEIIKNRNPFDPEIQKILKTGELLAVYNTTQSTTPRLFIHRPAAPDPQQIKEELLLKVHSMIGDILLIEDDQMAISGVQVLIDAQGLTMAQIYTPAMLMKSLKFIQGGLPARTQTCHVINLNPIFGSIYNFTTSLLSEKLKRRVIVYNKDNLEELNRAIPRQNVPREYSGDGPSVQELIDFWKKKVESYAEWFKEDEKYGTTEILRPGKPKTSQEMFGIEGVEGSFRKLNVD